ncbi:Carbamoyl-phosphate synthase large chain [Candidatus Annandia adelgestsuga]|uniref:Carbamoyl phosphate synthase large chain n=1 Tax=Candidatus Annandia adelgestsuga TaxID=1302411 RepID=A0A3Q9CKR6_9ENTR|nr:carbamoyl-phosphate synthase large subunit [Candidatus Annandia adelgestsuga]AZP36248.1 Carbamoyl-phosphate synthase large chain [Candidatus Annandia adelgestsuga]
MPKRTDIKSILILGAGPIIIGQACEFDYSGTQACKILKKEGYRIILVNSNPATIMTDPEISDATYIEPIHWKIIEKIIIKEKPDALLPTMGGQIALNCALILDKKKILQKNNVIMIGINSKSINKAENRKIFDKIIKKIGLKTPKSGIAHSIKEANEIIKKIGLPCIIRPSFTMGGSGGGIAYNIKEFIKICKQGLNLSPNKELLIDQSLIGWKEYEMEIVRDKNDNCIIVCSIENMDSMGIHTGDSITVAPAQTLTDKEYQTMRNASISILKEIGIETGGSNVQFAVNPKNGNLIVIEMNPRVSRSSALASKATGFPIAKIAAKLAIGYTLDELRNEITENKTPSSFEPSIDYIVTKIPRFNFEKFYGSNDRLTTQMKSVGEVMAIGRNFQESLQKAIRSLEIGINGFCSKIDIYNKNKFLKKIKYELKNAGSNRIWYIGDAFRLNISLNEIYKLTNIDKWFLVQIKDIILTEKDIILKNINNINYKFLNYIKKKGFSDARIAFLLKVNEKIIRNLRYKYKIHPVYKRIDTCAAEFKTNTSYMYSTYENECESFANTNKNKIIVLGSGPNRIGQGIEFDYCCVHSVLALREDGFETIMINCNPETVSTDYDISDRLYFEPVTLEDILEIIKIEKPKGIIIQFGGQTPLKISNYLYKLKIPILGTNPKHINIAENRKFFKKIILKLGLKQPENNTATSLIQAIIKSKKIGYPVVIRPSNVLGGRSMKIIYNLKDLKYYFKMLKNNLYNMPVLLDKFLNNAIEIDVDLICDGKNILIGGIMEHIEPAGIHSGDSACSLPVYTINEKIQNEIRIQSLKLAYSLNIIGLMNIQFAIKKNKIYIIEVNPRASRTIPFISKATGISLAKIATRVMIGKSLIKQKIYNEIIPPYFSIKEVVLPFNKFIGINPILGPEMHSTGEVMGIGNRFNIAFLKAMLGSQSIIKKKKKVLISVNDLDKNNISNIAIKLINYGFKLDATYGTHTILKKNGIKSKIVNKINEKYPNIIDMISKKKYSYIIHTTTNNEENKIFDSICKLALQNKIHYDTTLNASFSSILTLKNNFKDYDILSLQELHNLI